MLRLTRPLIRPALLLIAATSFACQDLPVEPDRDCFFFDCGLGVWGNLQSGLDTDDLDFGEVIVGKAKEASVIVSRLGDGGDAIAIDTVIIDDGAEAGIFELVTEAPWESVGSDSPVEIVLRFTPGDFADYAASITLGLADGTSLTPRLTGSGIPTDDDGDGYDAEGTNGQADCGDDDALVYPGKPESCDLKDNDCDELVDEDVQTNYFADDDGDGYGDLNDLMLACEPPDGYVSNAGDCDDDDDDINPSIEEECDGVDQDCDSVVDEGVEDIFHPDRDGDGYGDGNATVEGCQAPPGTVSDDTDCDDFKAQSNPGATEICDNFDNNCDGDIDEGDVCD